MICPNCGQDNHDQAAQCARCGYPIMPPDGANRQNVPPPSPGAYPPPPPYQAPPYPQNNYQRYPVYPPPPYQQPYYYQKPPNNPMAVAGFIISCVALMFSFWGVTGLVGFILSIVGLNQVNETGQSGRGLAIAGIVIGAVLAFAGFVSLFSYANYF